MAIQSPRQRANPFSTLGGLTLPNRKPAALKALHGTRRASRKKNPPKSPLGTAQPPAFLKAEALKEWRRVVPVLEGMGLLTLADRAVLTAYCQAWSRWVEAERTISKEGSTYCSGSLIKRHPAVGMAFESAKALKGFMIELGLTPRIRQSLDIEPPRTDEEPLSIIDQKLGQPPHRKRRWS